MSLASALVDLAARIASEAKALRTLINGNAANLSSLATTAKTNLVAAINELAARERTWSKTVSVSNTYTFTFASELGVTFSGAPRVQLTCIEADTSNPYVAQLTGAPSTTGCTIRAWRVGSLIGANLQTDASVIVTVTGTAT